MDEVNNLVFLISYMQTILVKPYRKYILSYEALELLHCNLENYTEICLAKCNISYYKILTLE